MKLLETPGLDRPELRAWAMYDWANSAVVTTVLASLFPLYYTTVACADLPAEFATARYGFLTAASLLAIALASPLLGALADGAGSHKRWLALFLAAGVLGTAGMFGIGKGDWQLASFLFLATNIGLCGSFVFYDALLPHIARPGEVDRVSAAGYALGYVGGGVQLGISLVWILRPQWFGLPSGEGETLPARLAFLFAALWWLVFSIPLFRRVPDPPPGAGAGGRSPVRSAFGRLQTTFRELRRYRQAFLLLAAFLLYSDGIGTIIRMAPVYGKDIGLGQATLVGAILAVQFAGIPFAFLAGWIAGRIGPKTTVLLCLAAYTGITVFAYFMESAAEFWILALLVATVQGGSQALSRSLFASLIPKEKSGEFFGLFSVMDKVAGILGPLLFALTIELTGSSRSAILSVIPFFVLGGILLAFVKPSR